MTKAGWAGEDCPRCVFPTLVVDNQAQAAPVSAITDNDQKEFIVGNEAAQALLATSVRHGAMDTIRPCVRGEIEDFKSIAHILHHIYEKELKVDATKHPVLLRNIHYKIIPYNYF